MGIATISNDVVASYAGSNLTSWGSHMDGGANGFYHNAAMSTNASTTSDQTGDYKMVLVDIDLGDFAVISSQFGTVEVGFTGANFSGGPVWPAVSNNGNTVKTTINFGATAFNNTLPAGYTSWDGSQSA